MIPLSDLLLKSCAKRHIETSSQSLCQMPAVLSKPVINMEVVIDDAHYHFGMCFLNTHVNQRGAFSHLKLQPVYGSLGLNGHYEYGGKDYTAAEFKRKPLDSHCWLEDDQGRVYDFIFEDYACISQQWTGAVPFPVELLSNSRSRAFQ